MCEATSACTESRRRKLNKTEQTVKSRKSGRVWFSSVWWAQIIYWQQNEKTTVQAENIKRNNAFSASSQDYTHGSRCRKRTERAKRLLKKLVGQTQMISICTTVLVLLGMGSAQESRWSHQKPIFDLLGWWSRHRMRKQQTACRLRRRRKASHEDALVENRNLD